MSAPMRLFNRPRRQVQTPRDAQWLVDRGTRRRCILGAQQSVFGNTASLRGVDKNISGPQHFARPQISQDDRNPRNFLLLWFDCTRVCCRDKLNVVHSENFIYTRTSSAKVKNSNWRLFTIATGRLIGIALSAAQTDARSLQRRSWLGHAAVCPLLNSNLTQAPSLTYLALSLRRVASHENCTLPALPRLTTSSNQLRGTCRGPGLLVSATRAPPPSAPRAPPTAGLDRPRRPPGPTRSARSPSLRPAPRPAALGGGRAELPQERQRDAVGPPEAHLRHVLAAAPDGAGRAHVVLLVHVARRLEGEPAGPQPARGAAAWQA